MHDIKAIREAPERFDAGWAARGLAPQSAVLLRLDADLREAQTRLQAAQARRNEASRAIGAAMGKGDASGAAALRQGLESLKLGIDEATREAVRLGAELDGDLAALPNLPDADVPPGDEMANLELCRWGEPVPGPLPDHVEIGSTLGMMDFEAAARMSGARFVVLTGGLARLARAIGQFMLDMQTREHGYTEVAPPLLVRDAAVFGAGQLPKFADELFATTDGRWLISTSETPLVNLVRERILAEANLPLRYAALTPCFRSEAGASGKDTRGMIRQHQFDKVEMISIVVPEQSEAEHERMTACAEAVLKRLELPFRRVLLAAGDMGFSAAKTYDLEVWLPSQRRWREISSCSNCRDFQARRMDARCRADKAKGTRFVHTLNGSGLAVGRTLVAIMETYQDGGGAVAVPQALHPYMAGMIRIEAPAQ